MFRVANHENERRLLCKSRFFLVERRTSIPKMVIRKVFYETKASNMFIAPNHEKEGDCDVNVGLCR